MTERRYPSDLSDREWALIAPLLPAAKPGGRPRTTDLRQVCNAIFYIVQTGCPWRFLPREYPPHTTVYDYYATWRDDGVWNRINDTLREQTRVAAGRDPTPSAAILDSQSVPMAHQPGERGTDGHKRVKGRRRHVIVDTMGLLLAVVVLTANLDDRFGARQAFLRLEWRFGRLRHLWADGAYGGGFVDWVRAAYGWTLEIVSLPKRERAGKAHEPPAWRWVVERTFAWFGCARRLSKDYEVLPRSQEAMCTIAMIRLMLRRHDRTA